MRFFKNSDGYFSFYIRGHNISSAKLIAAGVVLLTIALPAGIAVSYRYQRLNPQSYAQGGGLIPSVSPITLNDETPKNLANATKLGPSNSQSSLPVAIGLKLRNKARLEQLLSDIYNPASPSYRQFLDPAAFRQQFAPTDIQVKAVETYLAGQGFTNISSSANNLLVNASGSVTAIEHTFRTGMSSYQRAGRSFQVNDIAPTVPGEIAAVAESIAGLDGSVLPAPHIAPPLAAPRTSCSGPCSGTMTPAALASTYHITPLTSAGYNGSGQTIAFVELDGYTKSDLAAYAGQFGISLPSISNVLVDGYDGHAGQGSEEDTLDLEVGLAVAPKANQIVYEAPNQTLQNFLDAANRAVTDNKAQVLSISWGLCEASLPSSFMTTFSNIDMQAAAQGMSVYTAAGDSGAYDCRDTNLAVDVPADLPYATAVGGTDLTQRSGGYGSETAWGHPAYTAGYGGGGGLSTVFAEPSYQSGPGVKNSYSNGKRQSPDVSADAGFTSPYAIYYNAPAGTGSCTG